MADSVYGGQILAAAVRVRGSVPRVVQTSI
jgi:hypothetical protein